MGRPRSAPSGAGASAGGGRKFRRAEKPPPGTVSRRGSVASSAGSEKGRQPTVAGGAAVRTADPVSVGAAAAASIRSRRRRPASASVVTRRSNAAQQARRARQAVEADLSSSLCVGSRRIIQELKLESRVHRPLAGKLQHGTNVLTESFLRCRMGRQCVGGKSPAERGGAMSPWAWEEWEDEAADAAAAAEKVAAAKAAAQAEMDREQGLTSQADNSAEEIFAALDSGMASRARPLTPELGLPSRMCRLLERVTLRHERDISRISVDSRSEISPSAGVEFSLSTSGIGILDRNAPLRARLDELHSRRPPPTGADAEQAQIAADNRVLRRLNRFSIGPSMDQLRAYSLGSLVSGNKIGVPELNLVAQLFSGAKRNSGLDEDEFVKVMTSAFSAPPAKLRVLFRKDGYVDCDEFLQFLMDRESLRNTKKNSLGGGLMINSHAGAAGGSASGLQTVCLRLRRRRQLRSSQQHGPSAPIAGQANAYMAERCICLTGQGMYATSDRHKGIVLWEADRLKPITRMRASAFTHPASGLEIGDPNVIAKAVAADEEETERREREDRKKYAEEQMSIFATSLAQASKSASTMELDKGEIDRAIELRTLRMERSRQQAVELAAEEVSEMNYSTEQSITALVDRLAGDGDPKGVKEAWKTSCVLDIQHWMQERILIVLMGNTLFVPFIAMVNLDPPFKRRAWGAIRLPKHPVAMPQCIAQGSMSLNPDSSQENFFVVGDSSGYVSAFRFADGMAEGDIRQFTSSSMDDVIEPVVTGRWHTGAVTSVSVLTLRNGIQYVVSTGMDGLLCVSTPTRWTPVTKGQVDCKTTAHVGLLSVSYCAEWNLFATGGADRVVRIWDDASCKQLEQCKGHNAPVVTVICNSHDGQILSVASDKTIKVWDLFSYKCVQTLRDDSQHFPSNRLTSAALDAERRSLVVVGSNLVRWCQDTSPEKMLKEVELDNPPTHRAPVVSVQWSTEFEQLVSVDEGGSVKIWEVPDASDVENKSNAQTISELEVSVAATPFRQSLSFDVAATHSADGKTAALPVTSACLDLRSRRLVTGAHDGSMWVWNINTGAALQHVGVQQTSAVPRAPLTPQGGTGPPTKTAGSASSSSMGERKARAVVGRAEVSSLTYVGWNGNSSDSGRDEVLIATGWQGALTMWGNYNADAENEERVTRGKGHDNGRSKLTIRDTCPPEDIREELPHCSLDGHHGDVLATASCRTHLASVCSKGQLLLWSIHKLSPGAIVKAHMPNYSVAPLRPEYRLDFGAHIWVTTLCYMAAFRALIIGCENGHLYFLPFMAAGDLGGPSEWSQLVSRKFEEQKPWAEIGDSVASIGCNDDGTLLVAADIAGALKIWRIDLQQHKTAQQFPQLTLIAAHTMRRLARLSPSQRATMQRTLRAIFNTVDTDQSGMIEADEFYQMCVRLDASMTDYEIKRAWAGMDMDGDAKITFDEFAQWWEEEDRKKATVKVTCISFLKGSARRLPRTSQVAIGMANGFCCGDEAGNICHFDASGSLCGILQSDGPAITNVHTRADEPTLPNDAECSDNVVANGVEY